jgi:hypothetical protein
LAPRCTHRGRPGQNEEDEGDQQHTTRDSSHLAPNEIREPFYPEVGPG